MAGRGSRDGQQPLLRSRAPSQHAMRLAAVAGVLGVATVATVWATQWPVGSSTGLLAWNLHHPVPEERKIMRTMSNEIAKGGNAAPADKATIAGLEHRIEALHAVKPGVSAALAKDRAVNKDVQRAAAKAAKEAVRDTSDPLLSRADKAIADADNVLNGAPDVVKSVLSGIDTVESAKDTNSLDRIDEAAKEEYKDSLQGYERMEEGVAPLEPTERRSQMEMDAKKDREILAEHFKAPGTKRQLQRTSPAVMKQMMWDLKHPSAEERKIQRVMQNEIAKPGKAGATDKALIAGLERKVESLEALNSKEALTNPPPGGNKEAMEHSEKVAAAAARAEEKKALAATTELVPKGPTSPALLRAESVAKKAAEAEVKKEELATAKFMKKRVKVDKLKLLGVREDDLGGVRHALTAGQQSAKKIPGVKEDTWPFAPGSFRYARKHPLPGVNEASWEIIPDFEGPKKASKQFVKSAGGCFPDGKGGLTCHGEQEKWMKKVKGWDKVGALPRRAPGTSLSMLLPHIREDAKQQKLEAAAQAFGDSMADSSPARTEELLLQGAKKARLQSLEQVAEQCSTFLDCLSMQGTVVPQYTHPKFGAEDDRIVRTQAQSLSHTAMHDAFNPELRPWRLVSKWPFEAGDRKVKMPKEYIGKISRLSIKSHHKSHMKYDVPAAEFPSDRLTSMYARERKELRGQALAAEKAGTLPQLMSLWEESPVQSPEERAQAQMLAVEANPKPEPKNNPVKPGARGLGVRNYENTVGLCTTGVNCDSSNWPFGEQDSMSDALVDAERVQNGGLGAVGPWTPMMYTGNKPTSYDPGAAYIPDYQFLASRRRDQGFPSAKSQMLRLQEQAQPQVLEEEEQGAAEGAAECPVCETCAEGDVECAESNAACMAEAEACKSAACGECEDGDEACATAKAACEAEAACLEGDNECIAAARGGFWSPMTGHIEKNAKEFEHMPRPQHHGTHKWHLPGVKVDSGWMPYKHSDVWGYDRRPGAAAPDPEVGGEDAPVQASSHKGLLSAGQELPKESWKTMDKIEHSDHMRAVGSIKHAWQSVVGGEEKAAGGADATEQNQAAGEVERGEAGKAGKAGEPAAYDWEKGPLYDAEGGEETSTGDKVQLFKNAPSLRMQEAAEQQQEVGMERAAEAERAHAMQEQQQLDQYLQTRFGTEVMADGGAGTAGRKLLSQDPNVEPKNDDTLNQKAPVRPPPPGDATLPRRARGKGRHARRAKSGGGKAGAGSVSQAEYQKGRIHVPKQAKLMADLRKVRSAADKIGEGPWSLPSSTDEVVRAALRHAGDDIRMLVGVGGVHTKKGADAKARGQAAVKDAHALNAAAGGKSDKDENQSQLQDLNALTADVDELSTSDDMADMRGVDAKLHTLVDNMRQRLAARH